ncbi:uncharacterized protein [Heptranchias perlo]|uniref:uncharacterized protein isoform X2 n=1 Tax=Heptranchias perlo TaxID=212740 RepID=UPI00355A57C1
MYHCKKIQENLNMRVSAESYGLTAALCHSPPLRSACNGKLGQSTERPWLESSIKHNTKHMGCRKEMHSQRLVQTNLAYTSQSLEQPVKSLPPVTFSCHEQQSNVEHYRQKCSSQNSINDRGNSNCISLHVESKHLTRDRRRYSRNSGIVIGIDPNQSFGEAKSASSKKQKKYFFHEEENFPPVQLSGQEVDGDSSIKVSESHYSLILGSPNYSLTLGDLGNVCQPSLDGRSNTLRSILKSSQTSASLHRSMLSLRDSNYKAKLDSSKAASINQLKFLTPYPCNYSNLPSGDEKEEWSGRVHPDVWKHRDVPKTLDCTNNCDSSLVHSNHLLNAKFSYPVWDACPQCSNTECRTCPPGLTCVCNRCENADKCMTYTEAEVSMDDYHSPSQFTAPGSTVAVSLTAPLTLPDKDIKGLHHSHCAVCQRSAKLLCNFPIKSINSSEMQTDQRVPVDREQSGTGTPFSNTVENRKDLSDKYSGHLLHSSMKCQAKSGYPVIIGTIYTKQDTAPDDLWTQESAQCPACAGLSLTRNHSNYSQGNLYSEAKDEEKSDLGSTGVGSRALRIRPVSGYSRNFISHKGEEPNKGEIFNVKSEDCSRAHTWEHVPILMEALGSNVCTNQLRQTFPLRDSQQLQSTEPRGFPLDGRTKRPVERSLKLYHQRLLLRCLCAWHRSVQQRYAVAICLQECQLLRKGLQALHWAVQLTQIQEEFLERSQCSRLLAHCFNRWRDAASTRQCQLVAEAPNTGGESCGIHLEKSVTLQLIGTKTYRPWRKQHEGAQSLSLASLHSQCQVCTCCDQLSSRLKTQVFQKWTQRTKAKRIKRKARERWSQECIRGCFDAWTLFVGQKVACQRILEKSHTDNLQSCFLQWRTMLQLKRGEEVTVLHLFQLCHTRTQQQITGLDIRKALGCRNHGEDDDYTQDGASEIYIQVEDVQLSWREPQSLDGIWPDQTLQRTFQDWREIYKLQLANEFYRIPTWSQLQDALKPWPEESFQLHLQGFSKHLPQRDCTATLTGTKESSDTNCSSPEQGIVLQLDRLHEARPADRPKLETAGKWLQRKIEKHLVEQHLLFWAARLRQVRRVERYRQRSLLARVFLSWSKWRQGRQRCRELVEGFSFSRQCRAVLTLWKMRLLQKLEADRRSSEKSGQKIQKAMSQWHTHSRKRQRVYDLQAHFFSVEAQKVKLSILSTWQQKAERQRNVKIMADGIMLRRYLRAWHFATLQTEVRRQNLWAFQAGQIRRILWGAFSWWRYHCELRRFSEYQRELRTSQKAAHCWRQTTLLGQALRHRNAVLTQLLFSSWKEAVRLSQLSHQLAGIIEERRLQLLLNSWANLVKDRKDHCARQRMMISAAQQRVIQAAFHQMVILYRKQKEAVGFYHLTLLRRSLLFWVGFVHQQKQWVLTVSAQVSVLQLTSVFVTWRNQLSVHRKLILLVQRRTERILQKALRSWYREVQAVRHRSRYVFQKFVSRWVLIVLAQKQADLWNVLEYRAEEHYRNQLCKQFLIIWRNKTLLQQFLEKKRIEEMKEIWKEWKSFTCQQRLEEKAWQMWRKHLVQMQVSRAFAAQDDRILMSDVFTAWRSLSIVKQDDPRLQQGEE